MPDIKETVQKNRSDESQLDRLLGEKYGKKHTSITPGLRWLFGSDSYPLFLDHPEYRTKDGKRTILGRPYSLSLNDLESLIELAHKEGISIYIRGESNYSPQTLLIILTEQENS